MASADDAFLLPKQEGYVDGGELVMHVYFSSHIWAGKRGL